MNLNDFVTFRLTDRGRAIVNDAVAKWIAAHPMSDAWRVMIPEMMPDGSRRWPLWRVMQMFGGDGLEWTDPPIEDIRQVKDDAP